MTNSELEKKWLDICVAISGGKSLRKICESDKKPPRRTVYEWLAKYPEFKEMYDRACQERAECYAEEIVDIADSGDDVQRDKLKIDARKWVASKLKSATYGDKIDATIAGGGGGPLEITVKHV